MYICVSFHLFANAEHVSSLLFFAADIVVNIVAEKKSCCVAHKADGDGYKIA